MNRMKDGSPLVPQLQLGNEGKTKGSVTGFIFVGSKRGSWDKLLVHEPFAKTVGPTGSGAGAQAEAVADAGVDVQLNRQSRLLKKQIGFWQAFGDVGSVIGAAGEERGRSTLGRIDFLRLTGINQALETGARIASLDRICGVRVAGIRMHGGERGEFAAG